MIMGTIRGKNKCLINGLTQLFTLFIKAYYIAPTDVLFPPLPPPPPPGPTTLMLDASRDLGLNLT